MTVGHTTRAAAMGVCARWTVGMALALCVLGVPGAAAPAEQPDAEEAPSKLEIDLMPYAWVPGNYGSVTVKGNTVKIDVTPSDLLQLLFGGNAFAGAGYGSVTYDRFFLFADSMGGYAEEHVSETIPTPLCNLSIRARDKIKFVITDVAFGYRLGQWTLPERRRPFTLGVYVGTRVMWFLNELHAAAGVVHGAQKNANVADDFSWADPMIGVRWSAPLLDWLSLDFRGDIGGFGASSDLIWGLVGTFKVWIPWTPHEGVHPYVSAGYRALDFDRSSNDGNIDLMYRGPLIGAGVVF